MSESVLRFEGVTRRFGSKTAVDRLDLHVESGAVVGLARRLVEAGVTFVTLSTAPDSLCWDWHRNIVNDDRPTDGSDGPTRGMDISGPPLDQMLAAPDDAVRPPFRSAGCPLHPPR